MQCLFFLTAHFTVFVLHETKDGVYMVGNISQCNATVTQTLLMY